MSVYNEIAKPEFTKTCTHANAHVQILYPFLNSTLYNYFASVIRLK